MTLCSVLLAVMVGFLQNGSDGSAQGPVPSPNSVDTTDLRLEIAWTSKIICPRGAEDESGVDLAVRVRRLIEVDGEPFWAIVSDVPLAVFVVDPAGEVHWVRDYDHFTGSRGATTVRIPPRLLQHTGPGKQLKIIVGVAGREPGTDLTKFANLHVLAQEDKEKLEVQKSADELDESIKETMLAESGETISKAAERLRKAVEETPLVPPLKGQTKRAAQRSLEKMIDSPPEKSVELDLYPILRFREAVGTANVGQAEVRAERLSKVEVVKILRSAPIVKVGDEDRGQ